MRFDDGLSTKKLQMRKDAAPAKDDAMKLRRFIAALNENGSEKFQNDLAFAAMRYGVVGGGDISAEVAVRE